MRQSLRFLPGLLLLLSLPVAAYAADRVDAPMRDALRALSAKASTATPADAIALYRDALKGPLAGYGRAHLLLAELYVRESRWPDAATHFKACLADERVDPIDRDLVCQGGFNDATAPLDGLPAGATARVLAPKAFAGPIANGDRLPRGEAELEVTLNGRATTDRIPVKTRATWRAPLGVPDAFVVNDPKVDVPDGFVAAAQDPVGPADTALRWPAYASAGVGAVLLGTGLGLGLSGQSDLDDLRARQVQGVWGVDDRQALTRLSSDATTADVLVYSGAALMAAAVALWFIFDSDTPDDDDDPDDENDDDTDDDADEDLSQ